MENRSFTKKEEWMLNYLKNNSDYANGLAVEFVSPTEVGRAYGQSKGIKGLHSSSASPTLIKLASNGLIVRNERGHYKFKKQ